MTTPMPHMTDPRRNADGQWRKSSYTGNQGNCVEVALDWRKSSYSGGNGDCVEVALDWHKSSHSGGSGECVEVAAQHTAALHGIRDSKHPDATALFLPSTEWAAFLTAAREGRL